jgi:guanylate cyclase, other
MESSGEEFKVHISEATFLLLQKVGGFICEERGITKIKVRSNSSVFGCDRFLHLLENRAKEKC